MLMSSRTDGKLKLWALIVCTAIEGGRLGLFLPMYGLTFLQNHGALLGFPSIMPSTQ